MKVTDSLDAALSTLVARPAGILPAYLVAQSVGTIARTLPLLGLVGAYLLLLVQGRLDALEAAFRAVETTLPDEPTPDPGPTPNPDPDSDPQALASDPPPIGELDAAVSELVTPGLLAVVALSLLGGLVVFVIVGATVHAGQIHTVYAALQGRAPIRAGVSGAIRDARPFVGLTLLEYGLYLVVTALYGLVVFVASAVYAADEGVGLVVAAGAALLAPVWLAILLAIAAVFLFAPQAIVVDGRGILGGLKGGVKFLRRRPGAFVAYVLIALALSGTVVALSAVLAVVGGAQVVSVITLLAVTPFLHLFKTGIYADAGRIDPDPLLLGTRRPVPIRVRDGTRTCLSSLGTFTAHSLGLIALSLLLFGIGTVGGYYATAEYAVETPRPEDPGAVFGAVPVGAFAMIAANNWLVAVGQAYAGLALGVPTAVNLLFNGAIVGIVSGMSADLLLVAALVVPHALIEVPALAISGAVGFRLARVAWRRARGRTDDAMVASELRDAFRVLVGLAIVFVIAAFIEAFLTPQIAEWLL